MIPLIRWRQTMLPLSSVWAKKPNAGLLALRGRQTTFGSTQGNCKFSSSWRTQDRRWCTICSQILNFLRNVGLEVLAAVVMKQSVFWNVTPCISLQMKWCFGGACHLHLQGRKISQERNQCESLCHLLSCWLLVWLILWTWGWRVLSPLKYQLTFKGVHCIIPWEIELFLGSFWILQSQIEHWCMHFFFHSKIFLFLFLVCSFLISWCHPVSTKPFLLSSTVGDLWILLSSQFFSL